MMITGVWAGEPAEKRARSAHRKRRLRIALTLFGVLLFGVFAFFTGGGAARANTSDFTFDSFHADYLLERQTNGDAVLTATETMVARFPDFDQNRGVLRAIPRTYQRASLGIDVRSVTDDRGEPIPYESEVEGDFLVLRIGDPETYVHGVHTYVITYTARNVVRDFSEAEVQEFYWDVNGTGWQQPFAATSMTLRLGDGLAPSLTGAASCYEGSQASTQRCEVHRTDDGFAAQSTGRLGPAQTLTVSVGFAPGTFAPPFVLRDQWYAVFLLDWLPWVVAGLVGLHTAASAVTRFGVLRHAPGRGIIVPEYEPPERVDPLVAGALLGTPQRGFAGFLTRLALFGQARLLVNPKARKRQRVSLALTGQPLTGLTANEQSAYRKLFASTAAPSVVPLSGADKKLITRIGAVMKRQQTDLVSAGWVAKRRTPIPTWVNRAVGWAVVLLIGWAFFATFIWGELTQALLFGAVLAGVCGWITTRLQRPVLRRTAEGTRAVEHLQGLRMYIQLAEADRLRLLQGPLTADREGEGSGAGAGAGSEHGAIVRIYEQLLPYAILFGLEREWAAETSRLFASEGEGSERWGELLRADSLSSVAASASWAASARSLRQATATTGASGRSWFSSSSSGSSSGSSGGGFAGGGGGGGGGGGW